MTFPLELLLLTIEIQFAHAHICEQCHLLPGYFTEKDYSFYPGERYVEHALTLKMLTPEDEAAFERGWNTMLERQRQNDFTHYQEHRYCTECIRKILLQYIGTHVPVNRILQIHTNTAEKTVIGCLCTLENEHDNGTTWLAITPKGDPLTIRAFATRLKNQKENGVS